MTIGDKLRAGLPKSSMWQPLLFVSTSVSRTILLWTNSTNECWRICIWRNCSDWQLLIKLHRPLVLFFLIHTEVNWECLGFLSLPHGLSLLYNDNAARLGTHSSSWETVKRVNYFQCFRAWSSVRVLEKEENDYILKSSMAFLQCFCIPPSSPIFPHVSKEAKQQLSDIHHEHYLCYLWLPGLRDYEDCISHFNFLKMVPY